MSERDIMDRLRPLRELPDGIVEHRQGQFGQIVVAKQGDELFLVFCPEGVPLSNDALSGVMSRINLGTPLVLTGAYTQAMLLCLAFFGAPKQVYVMGGGGGRVPMVLGALIKGITIQSSEIDRDVIELSQKYFGLRDGPRHQITCRDGQAHLSEQPDGSFDHIYLDCFAADGFVPELLTTANFLQMCAGKLSAGGVICMNMVDRDPSFAAQRERFASAFPIAWQLEIDGTHVLFGQMAGASAARDLVADARAVQADLLLGFDLSDHALRLTSLVSEG
ncbi:spermidine synthase [Ruegeria jejuensis]|uniref:spermidine synthase n=1 Tax=Ruegeria jejuensis TaxID=3233338 RepID=UPI00355BACFB